MNLPVFVRAGCDVTHIAREITYEEKRGVDANGMLAGSGRRAQFISVRIEAEK
ncbi:hypothetical protein G3N95_03200 [Paraburkholderia sp. Tr-20389]|uniref:hypothetical protein n=1 Tax=Paraburkholderia sp. Tr-20389 TaxID=2703903 RepID=UPI0019817949|nr:hypothetical protein [Paraburkholderia sp. Tr-20389]MBN3751933.1 hypothetical protein [Paraburkholderia sp. Tr-20389]